MRPRLVFFGSSDFGLASLEQLRHDALVDVVGVVTQSAKPKGRGAQIESTAVARWAKSQKLSMLEVHTLRRPEIMSAIKAYHADVFLVAAFGLILPSTILSLPAMGALNIHASLLPKYRGASPIAAAILAGEAATGVTFMLMDPGMDTGPILTQYSLPIGPTETTPLLTARLSTLAAQHIHECLRAWLAQNLTPRAQSSTGASLAPKISKQDGTATWESAILLERKIRAYQPWPGVTCRWHDRELKLLSASVIVGRPHESPGSILPSSDKPGWRIACQDGWLVPDIIQFANKRPQSATTVPGSYPNFIGSQLT